METNRHILLLDSDAQSAQDIQRFLGVSAYAFRVNHAADVPMGVEYLKKEKPDVVLLDASISTHKDFDKIKRLTAQKGIPVILLSDASLMDTKEQAENAGADEFLLKNKINLFHLQKTILSALQLAKTETVLNETVNDFTAQQQSLMQVLNRISEGVLVLNDNDAIRYANKKAHALLADEAMKKHLASHLHYRDADEEEVLEIRAKKKWLLTLRISSCRWADERATLFIIERTKIEEADTVSAQETLQQVMQAMPQCSMLLQNDAVLWANKKALRWLGYKQSELHAKPLHQLLKRADNSIDYKNLFEEQTGAAKMMADKNRELPVHFHLQSLPLEGELFQLLTFEPQEESAAPQPEPLQHAPAPKELFSTDHVLEMASHDLREPVRTILNYVQLIADKLRKEQYESATEYADFAAQAAQRMEKLLSDLKQYIQLNTHDFSPHQISLKLVVNDVLKQLKPRIDEAHAEINIAELPEIQCDRELTEKLFYQLIDNAIKFRRVPSGDPAKTRATVIDIGFDRADGKLLFCIRDNGIGIAKKYQDKLFQLFTRLNRVDEFPGNGIGLAIAKKCVDLHNGKIWVESLPGFGSSFYFTL